MKRVSQYVDGLIGDVAGESPSFTRPPWADRLRHASRAGTASFWLTARVVRR